MVESITLVELRERIDTNPELVLVDAQPDYQYRHSHLPGAINIAPADVEARAAELLADKDAQIVVYGTGADDAGGQLRMLGYTNVRHFQEGTFAWMQADLPTEGYGNVVEVVPEPGGDTMPIACNLTKDEIAGADERLAGYRRLGRDGLLSIERAPQHVALRFRRDRNIRRRVDALVAAESRCCAFLGYNVDEEPDAIVLTLTAPEGGEQVMADLINVLAAESPAAL
jgi:rhodanese-related sulfurtransferase